MIGPFTVDSIPTHPIGITVAGQDLSIYDLVEVVGEGLPAGESTLDPDDVSRVLYAFLAPFTEPGTYAARVHTVLGDTDDYSTVVEFEVTEALLTLVSRDEAYRATAASVSLEDLARAQALVAIRVDRDLFDEDFVADLSAADRRRLSTAIAWTATMTPAADPGVPAIKSWTEGDRSVTLADPGPIQPGLALHPVAEMAIGRLSWMQSSTIRLGGLLASGVPLYDTASAFDPFHQPVTRPPLDEDELWHEVGP